MCRLSNLKMGVFPELAQHNLCELLDAGLVATVNSDDPGYFGGYMNDNLVQIFQVTGLTARTPTSWRATVSRPVSSTPDARA